MLDIAGAQYGWMESELSPEITREIERQVLLRVTDTAWVQHLTSMESLRQGIGLHSYGQRDPLVMYKREGHQKFQDLRDRIRHDVARTIFHVAVRPDGRGNGGRARGRPRNESPMTQVTGRSRNETVKSGGAKVGRNEPCPCGSGQEVQEVPRSLARLLIGQCALSRSDAR